MSIPEFKFAGKPLEEKSMGLMMGLIMNSGKEVPMTDSKDLKEDFIVQMSQKRIEAYDLKFTLSDFFVIACISTFVDRPGNVMIMLWLAFNHWKKCGKDMLGINEWVDMFPNGTPTDAELQVMWESQKSQDSPLGNMLDSKENWV